MTQTLALANAIDQFITGCKADGTWGAIKSSCVLVGWNNLNGALVPLVGTAPTNFNFWGDADPSWASVSLLLRMNGANASTTFSDSSSNAFAVSRFGNAQISTAQSKFGGASGLFDGDGDYLTATSTATPSGTQNFTLEGWFYISSLPVSGVKSISHWLNVNGVNLEVDSTGKIGLFIHQEALFVNSSVGITAVTWNHIALVRSGNTFTVYLNGTSVSTLTSSVNFNATTLFIARDNTNFPSRDFNGYIDDYRITKGVARYTSNFTPPTQTFPGATADYNRETGLVGDGSTKYLDSNRNNNADPQNSQHLSVFISVQSTGATNSNFIAAGDFLTAGSSSMQTASANTNMFARSRNSLGETYTAKVTGFFGKSRSTSASFDYRFSSTTATTSSTSQTPVNDNVFVFRGNAATPAHSDARLAFYSIGESLNLTLLDTRVTALVNAIAAAIP